MLNILICSEGLFAISDKVMKVMKTRRGAGVDSILSVQPLFSSENGRQEIQEGKPPREEEFQEEAEGRS